MPGDHVLHGFDVWARLASDLTGAGRARTGRATLAVAYIGTTADQWLILRAGDLLVCDASDGAVRGGLTDVAQLRRWHATGVALYSREGLHMKTGAVGRRGFLGSANVSANSNNLVESVLVTSNAATLDQIRTSIEATLDPPCRELNDVELDRLARIPVVRRTGPRAPRDRPVVVSGRLWAVRWVYGDDDYTATELRYLNRIKPPAGANRADFVNGYYFDKGYPMPAITRGDSVLLITDEGADESFAPSEVVDVVPASRGHKAAFFHLVRRDLTTVPFSLVVTAVRTVRPGWRTPHHDIFRLPDVARDPVAALAWKAIR